MTRRLYLHEYIDVVGEGAAPYMQHTVEFDAATAADRALELVGTWCTMGSTGRWPQVLNLWEIVDGWAGWRRLMEATNLHRAQNPALETWWRTAYEHRRGGFDRLLAAAPGCPSLDDLRRGGVSGSVFVHELSRCRPGAASEYLAAVREEWMPVLADHAHTVVGLYEVLLTDTEVVTIWATDPSGHVALMATDDERVARWRVRARDFLTRGREELMTPHSATFLSRGDPP